MKSNRMRSIHAKLTNPYLTITDNKQYYNHPVDIDIMKCLISKRYYCSLSEGLYLVQGSADCVLALSFINDNAFNYTVLLH